MIAQFSPFHGTLNSRIEKVSSAKTQNVSMSNIVILYLPEARFSHSLESLLADFVAVEEIEGCDTKRLQQSFGRLPDILCLHINRKGYRNNVSYKRRDRVTFPLSLCMDGYLYPAGKPERSKTYALSAATIHLGDDSAGHCK